MKRFTVLDRATSVHQNHFLEASAGTGKTFAIEHVLVRLLIETDSARCSSPAILSELLVVTFTRAATRELRKRIRSSICSAVKSLTGFMAPSCHDYLLAIWEIGPEAVQVAKRRLEHALFIFDEAQVFTIHSFCHRMLQEYLQDSPPIPFDGGANSHVRVVARQVIKDFFRTEVGSDVYSSGQVAISLKEYKGFDSLVEKLVEAALKPASIEELPDVTCSRNSAREVITTFKERYKCSAAEFLHDFLIISRGYKGINDKKNKESSLKGAELLAGLLDSGECSEEQFDGLLKFCIDLLGSFTEENRNKNVKSIPVAEMHYPELLLELCSQMGPILNKAGDPLVIFARMARQCQAMVKKFFDDKAIGTPDDILQSMEKAMLEGSFVSKVAGRYRAAIVDEFQDTDPVQWDIFQKLFLSPSEKGPLLYLVGDPKQSIYAFRQADIYTYLKAAEAMGEECLAFLDVNYRSQKRLVAALNGLFNPQVLPGFMLLPRINKSIDYIPVTAGITDEEVFVSDKRGSLHFFAVETERGRSRSWPSASVENTYLFPFIAQEIQRLVSVGASSYSGCAVLVNDQYQARRLQQFFKKWGIPATSRKSCSITQSLAYSSLIELLEAVIFQGSSAIRCALGGLFLGWNHQEIIALEDEGSEECVLLLLRGLRQDLYEGGFARFYFQFMQSRWKRASVAEDILSRDQGGELHAELQQLAELLIDAEAEEGYSPEQLLLFLKMLEESSPDENERLKIKQRHDDEAVPILTLHVSKGLEFDVVFALGLVTQPGKRRDLVSKVEDTGTTLSAPEEGHEDRKQELLDRNAEKMRLLYVAMTRAKKRLYVPVAASLDKNKIATGRSPSAMEFFLAKLGRDVTDEEGLERRIQEFQLSHLSAFLSEKCAMLDIGISLLNEEIPAVEVEKKAATIEFAPLKGVFVPNLKVRVASFSSLMRPGESSVKGAPYNYEEAVKSAHTLPAGADIGVLLHSVLENINYSTADASCITPFIEETPFKEWSSVIEGMVLETLTIELPGKNGMFTLASVPQGKMIREMEFLFPCQKEELFKKYDVDPFEGMIRGFVDLVVEHEGYYYLIDWKSNWLGPDASSYQQENLALAMTQHGYALQAVIYREAWKKYIALVDKRPFEECFGGVFYLFLRGINNGHLPGTGIFSL